MTTLIKNGTLITASDTFQADILIENEQISQIGKDLTHPSAEVINASGKFIMPGGIDPHTHFDLAMMGTVSSDDHYTGHKAAAFGGTTTVMDFAGQEPQGFRYSVERWLEKTQKAAIDYSFHMNLNHMDDTVAADISTLREMGVMTLKVFTAYNGRLRLDDGGIFRALRIARDNGMLTMVHCENGDVIEQYVQDALTARHTTPE